ncbi:hypothetical protein MSAN_01989400 [Mycena sanguinolenta]|uniref:Uncharacterized protein n=1 Tax=Mycena sanguinolenta TaxID=230812 RepID=A0A8H6XK82_9AGAR|nr:hypothetical protein MSAN_01989400 [Mycena sanguinolenta]
MTEYDYSEEGRQRFLSTQRRITKWVRSTESASAPQFRSQPYSPPPMGSEAFRLQDYHPSASHSHRSHGQTSHRTYHESQPSRMSPSSSRSGSGSHFSSVTPSQSISQAPRTPSSTHSHSHSPTHSVSHHSSSHYSHPSSYHSLSHSHSHHHHHRHRHPTYVTPQPVLPPNTYGYRTPGVIIIPRRGQSPQVVFY